MPTVIVRGITDNVMWTHVFFVYEVFRAYKLAEYKLTLLGGATTLLSLYYHRYKETRCQPWESYAAKTCFVYILYASRVFPMEQRCILSLYTALCIATWMTQARFYEDQHALLHVLAAAMHHKYLDFYARH